MKLGIMADAHGNIYGLEAVTARLRGTKAEQLFFLGDALNYFSRAKDVLAFLRRERVDCLKGNHELMVLGDRDVPPAVRRLSALDATQAQLSEDDLMYLASWPESLELTIDGLRILMVHASPFDHFEEYVYPDGQFERFAGLPYDVIFMGHTHIPFQREIAGKLLVNVGSAGIARDDGRYVHGCLFDTRSRKAELLMCDFPSRQLDDLGPFADEIRAVLARRREVRA